MAITVAATGSGRERASMRIAGQQKGDSECVDFIDRGGALGGLYRHGWGTVWTLYTGVGHWVDFIDRGGALCGLYRQGWGTGWSL